MIIYSNCIKKIQSETAYAVCYAVIALRNLQIICRNFLKSCTHPHLTANILFLKLLLVNIKCIHVQTWEISKRVRLRPPSPSQLAACGLFHGTALLGHLRRMVLDDFPSGFSLGIDKGEACLHGGSIGKGEGIDS